MSELVYSIDVSSHQQNLAEIIDRHKPSHVICHAYIDFEAATLKDVTRQQIATILAKGCTPGMYVWAFQAAAPAASVEQAVALFREQAEPPVVWMDCETYDVDGFHDPGPDVDWLYAAGQAIDALGLRKGIYTAPGYAQSRWGARAHELADWLLWLADWTGVASLESRWLPLYGWTTLAGRQWAVRLPGDEELDRDVFLPEYTLPKRRPVPVPTPEPEPDPRDQLIADLKRDLDDARSKLGVASVDYVRDLRAAIAAASAVADSLERLKPAG